MLKRWMRQGGLALSAGALAGALTGCSMFGGAPQAAPPPAAIRPLAVVSAPGATVTVDDGQSGSPVDLRTDQQLVVRLHYEGMSTSQWELVDFTPGPLAAPGPSRFEARNGDLEVQGGDQIWRFQSARAGQVVLNFAYRPPRSREEAIRTVTYRVTVR